MNYSKELDFYSWPSLYKKTSTGAIQYWTILVYPDDNHSVGWQIVTNYGQVSGKEQSTYDSIYQGKNAGKKNETTPEQQAVVEAQSKYEKQLKKGYVTSMEAAQAGATDALIEGGINPMLAHKFEDHAHKITYPVFLQPKLDGIRCIAIIKQGKCKLYSRTRKPITSMPHIVAALESISSDLDMTLDGELYAHAFKTNFEHIVSMVRQEKADPRHTDVEYHIYDIVNERPFSGRTAMIRHMPKLQYIVKVETVNVKDEMQVMQMFEEWRKEGYEGAMIRNADSLYENKRSYGLQKIKKHDDAEFEITGIEEGRGKLAGHCGAFICKTASGNRFLAKMSGDTSKLKEYFENHSLWFGKLLTVKYWGFTGSGSVPRFPIGMAIRDYE